ncbi:DNA primase [Pseudomonas sp. 2FE]|uniref:DNA primase n=1 Tax=Pseudomonas sp. 2FE TaxID=2502190 RepID=UPI0010F8FF41|nr:DNA primase [Pseudomonas sp. 2FE]
MVRVDFDVPSYLRLEKGLCIVSSRLAHKLPEPTAPVEYNEPLEPVVINRLYNPRKAAVAVVPVENDLDEIKGEFIPRDAESDHHELMPAFDEANDHNDSAEQATEISFQGVAGKSVTGAYAGSGFAPYRFSKKNGKSFYLRIGKHLIWGVELKSQLRNSGAEKGDVISVTFLGKKPVKVLKDITVDGNIEQDWVDTYRNSWEIKVVK